jgi:hypothetical protein
MHKRWKEYLARLLQGDDQKMEQLRTRLDRLVRDGSTLVVEHIYTSVNDIDDRTKDIKSDTCKIGKIGVDIDNMKHELYHDGPAPEATPDQTRKRPL